MSTWRFGKLLLGKYCLASEREATAMNFYTVTVVENNDTPIDNNTLVLNENFHC